MESQPHQVTYLTPPKSTFEEQYKSVRDKENRWLSDDIVKQLPQFDSNAPLASEWKKRAWMLNRFLNHVNAKRFDSILDIGCGNGWMTNHVANCCTNIIGVDVGQEELEQAARCFGNESIRFICCEDWSLLPKKSFDLIYFAGSFHYFDPDEKFWNWLLSLLKPGGEIHILETHFYQPNEVELAQKRSQEYFESLGTKVDYYKHFSWDVLPKNHEVLYRPNKWNKVFKNRSPFPWIRIRK